MPVWMGRHRALLAREEIPGNCAGFARCVAFSARARILLLRFLWTMDRDQLLRLLLPLWGAAFLAGFMMTAAH